MLSTVRLAKRKASVAAYLQLTKSLTVQSGKVRTQSSLPMPMPQRPLRLYLFAYAYDLASLSVCLLYTSDAADE